MILNVNFWSKCIATQNLKAYLSTKAERPVYGQTVLSSQLFPVYYLLKCLLPQRLTQFPQPHTITGYNLLQSRWTKTGLFFFKVYSTGYKNTVLPLNLGLGGQKLVGGKSYLNNINNIKSEVGFWINVRGLKILLNVGISTTQQSNY